MIYDELVKINKNNKQKYAGTDYCKCLKFIEKDNVVYVIPKGSIIQRTDLVIRDLADIYSLLGNRTMNYFRCYFTNISFLLKHKEILNYCSVKEVTISFLTRFIEEYNIKTVKFIYVSDFDNLKAKRILLGRPNLLRLSDCIFVDIDKNERLMVVYCIAKLKLLFSKETFWNKFDRNVVNVDIGKDILIFK